VTEPAIDCERYGYSGPIFDGDTHLYETEDAWTRCMPADLQRRWPFIFRPAVDGEFALHVGDRKVQVSAGRGLSDAELNAVMWENGHRPTAD
jgi:hypothetical protein